MVAAGLVLVVVGLAIVWPSLLRGIWEWVTNNPGVVTTVVGLLALVFGVVLIRRGLRRHG